MRLPALSVIIAIQALIWCVAGSLPSVHGPKILLYPLAWGLIVGGFYLHAKTFPISKQDARSTTLSKGSEGGVEKQQAAGTKRQKLATG